MDLNWCQYCETQLQEDFHGYSSGEDLEEAVPPTSPKHSLKLHGKKAKGSIAHRRNQSSTKLNTKLKTSTTIDLASSTSTKDASDSDKHWKPWTGSYCSEECMKKDEQRSRLAFANLKSSSSNEAIAPRTSDSSSSNSKHSANEEEHNPYINATAYASRPGVKTYSSYTRSRPTALNLRRASTQNDRGSSDSLKSLNSPRQFSPSFPIMTSRTSTRSILRPMTPIAPTFEEEETRTTTQSNDEDGSLAFPATLKPESPILKATRSKRKSSVSTTKAGILPTKSLAIPLLSQGLEGNAVGMVFSARSPGIDTDSSFYGRSPRRSHRSRTSTSSIPGLSCSPSSPTESDDEDSSRSDGQSSHSTAPSEAPKDYFAHRRTSSSAYLPVPFLQGEATLQDYKLYSSRPSRTPSIPALPNLAGKSPPRPIAPLSSSFETSGTISRIVQAKVQQRYASPDGRRRSKDLNVDGVPFPSVYEATLTAQNRNASFSSIKRVGSSASVTSLPHHMPESVAQPNARLPRNRSSMSIHHSAAPLSPPYLTTVSTSAPKAWNWDGLPQYVPQYTAMKSSTSSSSTSGKKRLFYFNATTPTA